MSDHTPATTPAKSAPIILCGPQAVGKTRHAQPIAAALGCERIVAGRPVYLGARGTPETLRTFVCKVTNFH